MGPAAAVFHLVVAVQPLVLCQRIGLQVALVSLEEALRSSGGVIGREVEDHIRIVRIPDTHPQVCLLGTLGTRHAQLHGRIVTVEHP
jgi:hypothetical protein